MFFLSLWGSLLNLWFSRRVPKTLVDLFARHQVTFDSDIEKVPKTLVDLFVRHQVTFDSDVEKYVEERNARKKRD
ncbi:hypothetical protein JTE90_016292 [Oedothorax gibbosus]|uniref:Uncharacterized protein n=1 Tax=Oedothorax gibbosus TaxID=931172 RepID=A0AAV6U3J2_9ARAC|nr:hypothetical protein JTE90_016292 [Oedothorax gibbosus]